MTSIRTRIEILDSCFIPAERHFINEEECKLVRTILDLESVSAKEKFIEVRNEVVKFYSFVPSIRKMYSQESCGDVETAKVLSKQFDIISDKFSAIIGVIDDMFARRDWL